ncbi:MAG: hypothetical protein QOK08_357, partial [Actinomycetota bacterium]|nr:hypothetical protein [Actinomycetota bacterium]
VFGLDDEAQLLHGGHPLSLGRHVLVSFPY